VSASCIATHYRCCLSLKSCYHHLRIWYTVSNPPFPDAAAVGSAQRQTRTALPGTALAVLIAFEIAVFVLPAAPDLKI
jgi:hypothetical protein